MSHPRKTSPRLLSHSSGPRRARPPPSQPPLPPRSWRALHSPGPFQSLHGTDIIASCHGNARLSKTRPLGLIPCVSGNEGFIAHPRNGAGTAAGDRGQPTLVIGCPAWGNRDLFLGVARLIYVSGVISGLLRFLLWSEMAWRRGDLKHLSRCLGTRQKICMRL